MCAAATEAKPRPAIVAIAVASGAGALDPGCKDGPAAFRRHWERSPCSKDAQLVWERMPENICMNEATPLDVVARIGRWLATATCRLTERGSRFLVIGGDHSSAIGTWSGASRAMRRSGPLGLVWIDAHMDMHVPETTHSGAINGMPVAALLGYGAPELTGLAGNQCAIEPRHICLVGVRSFEQEEVAFARRCSVRIIEKEECVRRGIKDTLDEARRIA